MKGFSVLMSVYANDNSVNFIAAIDSVLQQSLLPEKIVLVKDGKLPSELEHIINNNLEKYPSLFKIIPLPVNKGLGNALRIGLENCETEIVARMDSDDICYYDRFEVQVNYLINNPDTSVIGCSIQEFNEVPGDLSRFRKLPLTIDKLRKFAKHRNPLNHPSVVFRKSHIQSVGGYLDMALFEDYYLWIRLLNQGYEITNLDQSLLHFRIGNDMIGRRHGYSYAKKEFNFLSAVRAIGYLNRLEYYLALFMKIPLRLLPKKVLEGIYKILLR